MQPGTVSMIEIIKNESTTISSSEKIKALKAENKKLVVLLKDSEKLFYQKIKETRKESENLNAVFKQVWPLIKHKVKDPGGLLKTIGINDLVDGTSSSAGIANFLQPNEADQFRLEIEQLKQTLA